eukprot:CAMPEP_0175374070 /NCGR_PEP_ID=MMETSP0095-20121207/23057_1 /TAXON_ID=311494 /ORGANISM="Alexandrium monilatum, Strain CCMP3105" /LENGTH=37 /DNA_ID= /DNA_START= /DNA_END= /DNA_ORIENTATION=
MTPCCHLEEILMCMCWDVSQGRQSSLWQPLALSDLTA